MPFKGLPYKCKACESYTRWEPAVLNGTHWVKIRCEACGHVQTSKSLRAIAFMRELYEIQRRIDGAPNVEVR
jgi:hypothetical protein